MRRDGGMGAQLQFGSAPRANASGSGKRGADSGSDQMQVEAEHVLLRLAPQTPKPPCGGLEPIQEVGIQKQGAGLVKRLSMMRIMARRTNAAPVRA